MTGVRRKRFGQHFLHDPGTINKIHRAINAKPMQHLVEIGPGAGAITQGLVDSGCQLDLVELDRDLIAPLQERFHDHPQLHIHNRDVLDTDIQSLATSGEKLRVVGNLPYNISTPLLFHLLAQLPYIQDMHFMLQKEVGERIAAAPGGGTYGRLSVMVQYFCTAETLFTIKPGAFSPPPRVTSIFVRLQPHTEPPVDVKSEHAFEVVVRQAFSQRRKTLRNALRKLLDEDAIRSAGVDPGLRAENLGLAEYAALTQQLADMHT